MRKLQYITLALITVLVSTKKMRAQLPYNDTSWVLQTSLSDEFNSLTFKSMWNLHFYYPDSVNNGAEFDYPKNDTLSGTMLVIKADTLKPNHYKSAADIPYYGFNIPPNGLTYAYQGGMLQNTNPAYRFGYIEISAKFPSKKYPLWPAFWLQSSDSTFYNEIDIAENGAGTSFAGNQVGNNWHVSNTHGTSSNSQNVIPVLASTDSLSGAFHTYGLEWNPTSFTFYFDHKATLTVYDPTGVTIPQHGMTVILNFCIDPWWAYLPSNWNGQNYDYPNYLVGTPGDTIYHGNAMPTKWPQYFIIDYLRYYKLPIVANCSTPLTICSPSTNYSTRGVYQSINTGGGSCGSGCTFNPIDKNTSYTLRATDYVELDAGTTINAPSGTGYFAVEMTACPQ